MKTDIKALAAVATIMIVAVAAALYVMPALADPEDGQGIQDMDQEPDRVQNRSGDQLRLRECDGECEHNEHQHRHGESDRNGEGHQHRHEGRHCTGSGAESRGGG